MTWTIAAVCAAWCLTILAVGWAAGRIRARIIEKRERTRAFKAIGAALEHDIAAAEARGLHVDKGERIMPSHKRIRF